MVMVQNHLLKARSENPDSHHQYGREERGEGGEDLTFACLQTKGESLEAVMRRKRSRPTLVNFTSHSFQVAKLKFM